MKTLAMTTNKLLRLNDLTNEIEEVQAHPVSRKKIISVAELEAGGYTVEQYIVAWLEDHEVYSDAE